MKRFIKQISFYDVNRGIFFLALSSVFLLIYPANVFAPTPDITNPSVSMRICGMDPSYTSIYEEVHQYDLPLQWFLHECAEIDDDFVLAPTTKFAVMIYAPAWNTDPDKIDIIGNTPESKITITTSEDTLSLDGTSIIDGLPCNGFAELAPDLGLFQGAIWMTGFPYDYDGDGIIDTPFTSHAFTSCNSGSPYGVNLSAGMIQTGARGGTTISWEANEDLTFVKTIKYGFREGQIWFDKPVYDIDDEVTIILKDIDYMAWDGWAFPWKVKVFSDSDTAGIQVKVFWDYEKNLPLPYFIQDTFYGSFTLTDSDKSFSNDKLRVNPGDNIYLEFDDYTLPQPYGDGDHIQLTDTAGIVFSHNYPSGISLNEFNPTNIKGEILTEFSEGDRIHFTPQIENHTPETRTITSIISIKNSKGYYEEVLWSMRNLKPHSINNLDQMWKSNGIGNYTAEIYIWDHIMDGDPLTKTKQTSFTIIES